MDRDYIWEGEYGRRSHLIPVFQQLLREQDASSLQMLSLFVNNNPYNLEFFIAVSYDRPKEEHLDRMFRLLEDAGLRQRKDLTALNIMRAMADRRFNSASLLDEDSVPTIMGHLFFFPEIRVLEEKGYRMTPFGREQMVFLSHSSLDKPEIEEIIPLLNGMDLPVWFDKYSIALGDSITDKVQEGIQQSSIVLFWITEHFLDSRWCKFEMRAFDRRGRPGHLRSGPGHPDLPPAALSPGHQVSHAGRTDHLSGRPADRLRSPAQLSDLKNLEPLHLKRGPARHAPAPFCRLRSAIFRPLGSAAGARPWAGTGPAAPGPAGEQRTPAPRR